MNEKNLNLPELPAVQTEDEVEIDLLELASY